MPEAAATPGEEFREDARGAGGRVLGAEELSGFTALDDAASVRAILVTLAPLAAAIAAAVWVWSPWIVMPAVVFIATRQHALFILAHEAAHYRLFRHRGLNDAAGRAIGAVACISLCAYRVIHRLHHNHLYGPQDPDIALHGGYPRGRRYLLRKLATDLTGWTAWKTYRYFFGAPAANAATGDRARPLDDTSPALREAALRDRRSVIATQIALPAAVLVLAGPEGLLKYLVLWVLPMITLLQALLRLRAIAEHGAPAGYGSPLAAARTHVPGWLGRLCLFPHHVGYHVEHHLYPAVPHYRLPALREALQRRGALAAVEVKPFGETWARVYADPPGPPGVRRT